MMHPPEITMISAPMNPAHSSRRISPPPCAETAEPAAANADDGHNLPTPPTGFLGRAPELTHLSVAPDEAGEPSPRRGLQAGAGRPGPHQLVHLDRPAEPLDRH